jgi:hypothetical protein
MGLKAKMSIPFVLMFTCETNGVSLNKKLGFLIYDDGGNMVPWNLNAN